MIAADAPRLTIHNNWDFAAFDERGQLGDEGLPRLVIYLAKALDAHALSLGVIPPA